jgi:hypothetical protein
MKCAKDLLLINTIHSNSYVSPFIEKHASALYILNISEIFFRKNSISEVSMITIFL